MIAVGIVGRRFAIPTYLVIEKKGNCGNDDVLIHGSIRCKADVYLNFCSLFEQ